MRKINPLPIENNLRPHKPFIVWTEFGGQKETEMKHQSLSSVSMGSGDRTRAQGDRFRWSGSRELESQGALSDCFTAHSHTVQSCSRVSLSTTLESSSLNFN